MKDSYIKYHKSKRSQISIKSETHQKLEELKFDLRLRSIDATINKLIELVKK